MKQEKMHKVVGLMLRRKDMLEVFKNTQFNNWAEEIINKANEMGGKDNITAIAIDIKK